jgi:hypothetical protein
MPTKVVPAPMREDKTETLNLSIERGLSELMELESPLP